MVNIFKYFNTIFSEFTDYMCNYINLQRLNMYIFMKRCFVNYVLIFSVKFSWLPCERRVPLKEPFLAGDGFDIYVDGCRFLPDSVTFSKVSQTSSVNLA